MSDVPIWIQTLQGLATPMLALAAIGIGYLQWRTAHQKVVLDLFDRRWRAFTAIKESLGPIFRDGAGKSTEDVVKIYRLMREAEFLFGSDVRNLLAKTRDAIVNLQAATSMMEDRMDSQYPEWVKAKHENFTFVAKFPDAFDELCAPYMRMDQKLIRTPRQWLSDQNQQRLSYADEKQK